MSVIKLSENLYFSTDDGVVISKEQALKTIKRALQRSKNLKVGKTVDKILGVDTQVVNLSVATPAGASVANNGFLVEVYLSGTDGVLTRMYRSPIIDPISETTIRGSFEDLVSIEVDI